MQRLIITMGTLFCALVISVCPAWAIKIEISDVRNGVAFVDGNKAAGGTDITWEGGIVTQTTNGGTFQFQGVVPSDCVGTLSDGADTIEVALANCEPAPGPAGQVLKTGQTNCWDSLGVPIDCGGTGQDGELQKGAARSYTDNGDGTITDNTTGLMWEKLTADATIHDYSQAYTWEGAFGKILALNAANFAGHNDWRLPNVNELQSLVDYGRHPAIDLAFNDPGANSYTAFFPNANLNQLTPAYWSSTTFPGDPLYAWAVSFNYGAVFANISTDKLDALGARALRGR